jgi:hypothetical protein
MTKKKPSSCCIGPDEEWRVESDLRTLTEAEQIKRDPKRFAKCQTLAQKRLQEVAAVAGADPVKP